MFISFFYSELSLNEFLLGFLNNVTLAVGVLNFQEKKAQADNNGTSYHVGFHGVVNNLEL